MSFGDEIMASGQALAVARATGRRVRIVDCDGAPRWESVWENLPELARPCEQGDFAELVNDRFTRPYMLHPWDRESGMRYSGWRARDHLGALRFDAAEQIWAAAAVGGLDWFVVVEPRVPAQSNPNKQWGWKRWQTLVKSMPKANWLQLGPADTPALDGAARIVTPTFRHAAAILAQARAAVLPEGGLHHAAAVLGVPSVVLFGASPSPMATGYPFQDNIAAPGEPCGAWLPCDHCAGFWRALYPATVAARLRQLLASLPADPRLRGDQEPALSVEALS